MIRRGNVVSYKKANDFRSVVLEEVLKIWSERSGNELRSLHSHIGGSDLTSSKSSSEKNLLRWKEISRWGYQLNNDIKNYSINNLKKSRGATATSNFARQINKIHSERGCEQSNLKIAIPETADIISNRIIHEIIDGKIDLKKHSAVVGKIIRPLFLFLDKEVLLYAKLRGLTFVEKKNKIDEIDAFIEGMEKKHPELYHSIVNSYLELA